MPKAPTLLATVLVGALLLGAGTGRADEPPLDQAAVDCAGTVPGHDYVGGDFQSHAAAAGIWSECLVGLRDQLQEQLQDQLDRSPPGSEIETVLKRVVKGSKRDVRKHALVVDTARSLEQSTSTVQTAKLLKRMHTNAYMTAGSVLESTQQAYSHAAQSSALFRLAVEQEVEGHADALLAVTAESAARFRKKGAKFALVAAAIGADLDTIEADVLSAEFTVGQLQKLGPTGKEKRAAVLIARALEKLIRRYHAGIRVLVKLEGKLQGLLEKAERAAELDPDPDPDPADIEISVVVPIAASPLMPRVREQVTVSVTLDLLPSDEYFQWVVDFGDGERVLFTPTQGGESSRIASLSRYFGAGTYEATVEVSWLKGYASGVFGISEPIEVFRDTVTVEIVQ